jgi:dTDP-4-amino-4,6-dideoxygalactose transaminase
MSLTSIGVFRTRRQCLSSGCLYGPPIFKENEVAMGIWPETDDRTSRAVGAALMSQRWAVATPAGAWPRRIALAERALARRFDCDHAVTVCNGSAALLLAMQAFGLGPGSRVLVPACTWVGCVTSILRLGATPVFCDAGKKRIVAEFAGHPIGNIDALLAIPLYSQIIDLPALRRAYPDAKIILDLSHVSASTAIDAPLDYADVLVSSLQASKVLPCGAGGFVGTNDLKFARQIEALRTDGRIIKHNELVPHGDVHGANYAMSEITAALLLDQLNRLDAQCVRRADGGAVLLDALADLQLVAYADPEVIRSGLHYGIPVQVNGDLDRVIQSIAKITGQQLDRCYPALANGPLFHAPSELRYREIRCDLTPMPNALAWHERCVLIPHEVLLSPPADLEFLARSLAGKATTSARVKGAPPPPVTVIVMTNGCRRTLERGLSSIEAQDYDGDLRVLLVLDHCNDPVPRTSLPIETVRIDLEGRSAIDRIAKLRDMAVRLVDTALLCFFDDESWWAPHHLSSLFTAMQTSRAPAVHCWRRLRQSNGAEWNVQDFPWLVSHLNAEHDKFAAYCRLGMITAGSDIVQDRAFADDLEETGIVDLGAWLLRTELVRSHGLVKTLKDTNAPKKGRDEEGILLEQFNAAHVFIFCSEQPTLECWIVPEYG